MSMVDLSDKEKQIDKALDKGITHDLAISDSAGGLLFANANQVMEFSKMMSLSQVGVRKHLRGNPGACLAICVQAIEWGLSPYAVANKSYLVNDQFAFESQLIQAVILKRAPIRGRIKFEFTGDGAKRVCRAWAELKEGGICDYVSPEFSKIGPKNSPLWDSDPDQQHCYYSGRALCRRHFPDILLGVYDRDEFSDAEIERGRAERPLAPSRSLATKLDALAASLPVTPLPAEAMTANEPSNGAEPESGSFGSAPADQQQQQQLDPIMVARQRGALDRKNGMQRRALPPEYRSEARAAEANAWRHGHDNPDDVLEEKET